MKYTLWMAGFFFSILQIGFPSRSDRADEFSGVFTESYEEKIFFPCDALAGAPGWWVRFSQGIGAGEFRYNVAGPGFPTRSHYMRVRGSLNGSGPYGTGFHSQEIVIDSVLEVSDTVKCESNFDLVPKPWNGAGRFHPPAAYATPSMDGKLVAVADASGIVTVWQSETGEEIGRYRYSKPPPSGSIPTTTIAFSPSSRLMAVGTHDGWIQVWTIPEGKRIWKLDHATHADTLGAAGQEGWTIYGAAALGSLAFTSDDSTLVSAGGERARVWSMTTGLRISELFGAGRHHAVEPSEVAMLHNPDRIVGLARDGTLRVYGPRGGPPLMVAPAPMIGYVRGPMKVSPDEKWLAFRVSQDSVAIWSLEDGKVTRQFGVPTFFQEGIAFSPDGKQFAMSGSHFAIYIWDISTADPAARVALQHGGTRNFWFTKSGESIVMTGWMDSTLLMAQTKFPFDRLIRLRPAH